jgi:YHS domain-containing protein
MVDNSWPKPSHPNSKQQEAAMRDNVEIDPVCGMEVDLANAAGHSEYEDRMYYFCSQECKKKFDLQPGDFAEAA